MKKYALIFLKGFIIGFCMLVPGVSGGTIAVLFGIYRELVSTVSSFFKNFKKNFLFLFTFCIGALPGFYLASKVLSPLLEKFPTIIPFLFCGIILAGVPFLWKKSGIKKPNWKHLIALLGGIAVIILIELLPEANISVIGSSQMQFTDILVLLCVGICVVISMVLPGLSTSHILLIFGMYNQTLDAIKTFNFGFIIPFGISVIVGIFLIAKLIDFLFKKFPEIMYCVIIGFVVASIYAVIKVLPVGIDWVYSIALFLIGFFGIGFVLLKFGGDQK